MNSKKRTQNIVIFALVIIAVIAIYELALRDILMGVPEDTDNTNTAVNASMATDPFVVTEGADGELIFTNNTYDYQITLPEDWVVDPFWSSTDTGALERTAFFNDRAMEQPEATELMQGMKIEVYTQSLEPGTTLEDIAAAEVEFAGEFVLEQKDTIVDSEPGKKIKTEMLGYIIATYVVVDDLWYNIVGYVGNSEDKEKYSALYSRILSNFEFID